MDENNEKILKDQIGNMGSEAEDLGKLQHIPGEKEELTKDEKSSLKAFQNATRHLRPVETNNIHEGWIPIDRGEMGMRSLFYPQDWEFRVRPASVEAIKNWSAIDEESLAAVNNVMNEIIRCCVSIDCNGAKLSWDKLNSWDRFWFILKVREYTFEKGEQALEFDEECDNCGATLHYVLRSDSLYYDFPDQEVIDSCWNGRYWDIKPADYGVQGAPIKMYVPTLGKDDAILQWLYVQNEQGKKIDEVFMRFLPYMLERNIKDPNVMEKQIRDAKREYDSWDLDMFSFMDEVRRNITINASEKLTQTCPNCGEVVKSTVRFPNGIKYLFAIQSRHKKFGSK